jgi:gliding motility-associated-like protein
MAMLVVLCFSVPDGVDAQCGPPIAAFPYEEDFEDGPAWTAGGTLSDWAWGAPDKPVIDGPGGGSNSWVIGGLTGSSYNDGQQSWLESPCFDLSGLAWPWLSFKIFWETERLYDGLGFQYSLDEGATWSNLGAFAAQQHCLNANWFNSANITGLNLAQPQQGWSGRIGNTVGPCAGGDGSEQWLTATHCLSPVAGQPLVKFRFVFGAGTICNAYDGIGIDDIRIAEAPPNEAAFIFSCFGGTVEFQDASTPCPTAWSWDFGDPGSGAANTSTDPAPIHTFSTPGTYQVRLAVSGPCNAPDTVVLPVTVIGVGLTTEDPGCSGNDGSIAASVSGADGPFSFSWSNGVEGSSAISGLVPGSYSVVVDAPGVCATEASAELVQQDSDLQVESVVEPISCHQAADGSIALLVSGGTPPYTFAWTPGGEVLPEVGPLQPGTYTCVITDADGCTVAIEVVLDEPEPLAIALPAEVQACSGSTITLQADVSGGTAPYTLQWTPDGPEIMPVESGAYVLEVNDANGCEAPPAEVWVLVDAPPIPAITVDQAQGCVPHCVTFTGGGTAGFAVDWSTGDGGGGVTASLVHCYTEPGNYAVELIVTDTNGCSSTAQLPGGVVALPVPVAGFTAQPPVTTIDDPLVAFMDASAGATQWLWSFAGSGDPFSEGASPMHVFTEVGCWDVQQLVWNVEGCVDSAFATICVEEAFAVYAPNAFTPNGDGINDVFGVVTTVASPSLFLLEVYDRWGRAVYVGRSPEAVWDGGDASNGVYVWRLQLRDTGGSTRDASGHVLLLR